MSLLDSFGNISYFQTIGIHIDSAKDKPVQSDETIQSPHYASTAFKLPIEYLDKNEVFTLNSNVISDLELVETVDASMSSIYSNTFETNNGFAKQVQPKFQKLCTTNKEFLKDTQHVIENMDYFLNIEDTVEENTNCKMTQENWTTVKHDPQFFEKYGYLDWNILKPYNENALVLQGISLSNMLSPVMSFILPLLFLLFPFIILKIQKIPITLGIYFQVLKDIARNHFIGQAISIFESFSLQKFMYFFFMLGLYGFQMYQNTVQCLRFYKNMERINKELCEWKIFRKMSSDKIEQFLYKSELLKTYAPFRSELICNLDVLRKIETLLEPMRPFSCSISKTTEIGYMLKCYYELHKNPEFESTILFCMGFDGYLHLMKGVNNQLKTGILNKAEYIEEDNITVTQIDISGEEQIVKKQCIIEEQYYPTHKSEDGCVKNDVVLDTYGVITGPNASGKTTYLKTTAINVILSQQLGVGFYKSCKMKPYGHIHSYLNIPDTSGRDSLFQAESRRCKEILDVIKTNKDKTHFCIFDELYSGTNPKEATKAAHALLEYLRQYDHVDLFLTTHYVSICDEWEEDNEKRSICNYRMKVIEHENGKNTPTYRIENGISRIEGAMSILSDMEYPEEMLTMITNNNSTHDSVIINKNTSSIDL